MSIILPLIMQKKCCVYLKYQSHIKSDSVNRYCINFCYQFICYQLLQLLTNTLYILYLHYYKIHCDVLYSIY